MSLYFYESRCYPVTIGAVTLYLTGCRLAQSRTLKEAGTADGDGVLTASYPGGMRLTLSGSLSPETDTDAAAAALAEALLSGAALTVTVGGLAFPEARLAGYVLEQGLKEPAAELTFYTRSVPVPVEEDGE